MKPLLYHLEYFIENGYFDRFPKGQAIKMVIGNDGGIQTLYGSGTGSGKVLFSSGKSVLFALDKSTEQLKVVFRAYSADKFLGEGVKIFKGTSFPKRTEVGEPASYTFGSDLGFRNGSDLVGAIKSFIRMTSFGENIISDCIKDGESYRVRMTSLIVERNKDPRKNVKPWWVILDGRRLRFSRWLRSLEKEDCAKDVFLEVKKCPDENSLPGVSETFLNEEKEVAMETVEAALKKDFDIIREFGSQETYDKGSQVNFYNDSSLYAFQIDRFEINSTESCCSHNNIISTSFCQENSTNFAGVSETKNSSDETVSSVEIQPDITRSCSNEMKRSVFLVSDDDKNTQNKDDTNELVYLEMNQIKDNNDCDKNISEQNKTNDESNVICNKKIKADDIFHFERSTSDLFGENASIESSGVASLISEGIRASDCEVETPIVTDRSFLAETIVREIINVIIERVFEREYCSLEEHSVEELLSLTKEESTTKVVRVVGYGDTESLMDLSVLGIAKPSACVHLSIPTTSNITSNRSTTSFDENEEDKEERNSPKTILICSNKMLPGQERCNEEYSSENCIENKYISTDDLRHESDVSCILIKCTDKSNFDDRLYYSREKSIGSCSEGNESDEDVSEYQKKTSGIMKPTMSSADHCISEWLKEDVMTPCFTCDEETKKDLIHTERWKRTIITDQTCFVESGESSSLPRPEDECRPDIVYSSDDIQSTQMVSSNAYHSSHPEPESDCSYLYKSSIENLPVSQFTKNKSQEMIFNEEFQSSTKTLKVIDPDYILKNMNNPSNESNSLASDNKSSLSEHALQK